MSLQSWQETLITASVDGSALTGSTTPTSLLPGAAKISLPSNYFQVGKAIRITAQGRVSNIITTPGTLTLDVRFGSVIVFNGGAMALNIVAKTDVTWWFEVILTCRAIGSGTSANMMGIGKWVSESVIGSPAPSAGGSGLLLLPSSAPAVGTGFDSTSAQSVDLFGTWSLNNANSIQVHQFLVESLN